MKKYLAISLSALLLLSFVGCKGKTTTKKDETTTKITTTDKGNTTIFKTTTSVVTTKEDVLESKGVLLVSKVTQSNGSASKEDTVYDEFDNLLSLTYYGSYDINTMEGKLLRKVENKYNSKNQIIEKVERNGSDLRYTDTTKYTYSNDLLIKEVMNDGEEDKITLYTYDSNNNLIMETTDNPREHYKSIYEYDDNNKLIRETGYIKYSGDYETKTKFEYTYDTLGRVKTRCYYYVGTDGSWRKESLDDYTYDDNGNVILKMEYQSNYAPDDEFEEYRKFEYKFSSSNKEIMVKTYSSNEGEWLLRSSTISTYDSNDRLVEKTSYKDDGVTETAKNIFSYTDID